MKTVRYGELKGFFAKHGIKNGDVADFLGISEAEFSQKINNPDRDFTLKQARMICTHYGITLEEFFLHP